MIVCLEMPQGSTPRPSELLNLSESLDANPLVPSQEAETIARESAGLTPTATGTEQPLADSGGTRRVCGGDAGSRGRRAPWSNFRTEPPQPGRYRARRPFLNR